MGVSSSATTATDPVGLAEARARAERALVVLCDSKLEALAPLMRDAIRYSILGGGKRLRPILLLEAYRAAGGAGDAGLLAAAVEVVHAYSLAHDDLPCMDDDDVRRGRPTLHRVFGVAIATAAGLAMIPLAAWSAADGAAALGLPPAVRSAIVRELMVAAGAGGMVGGQQLDLAGEGNELSRERLESVHAAKTGALIGASVVIGGMAAGADAPRVAAFRRYGEAIGLAFQIADDVLDATATSDQLGKTAGRDAILRKSTYPALLGIEGASARARALVEEGCEALRRAGVLTSAMEQLAQFSVSRRR